jgi:hypothetical protein
MPPTTESEIKELRDLVIGLREEIRVGFANNNTKFAEIRGEIQKMEAELKGEIQRVEGITNAKLAEIKGQVEVLDERTKIGFWGFIWRAVISGTLLLFMGLAVRFLLLGKVEI